MGDAQIGKAHGLKNCARGNVKTNLGTQENERGIMKVFLVGGKTYTVAELAMKKNVSAQCMYSYLKNHTRKYPDKTQDEIAQLCLDYIPYVMNKKYLSPCFPN